MYVLTTLWERWGWKSHTVVLKAGDSVGGSTNFLKGRNQFSWELRETGLVLALSTAVWEAHKGISYRSWWQHAGFWEWWSRSTAPGWGRGQCYIECYLRTRSLNFCQWWHGQHGMEKHQQVMLIPETIPSPEMRHYDTFTQNQVLTSSLRCSSVITLSLYSKCPYSISNKNFSIIF